MDRSLYVAMTGAGQTLQAQSSVAHNLANANTTGSTTDCGASSERGSRSSFGQTAT